MDTNRACPECGQRIVGRPNKLQCSPPCKQAAKRRYDRERYPLIAAKTVARAVAWQRENRERKQAYDAAYRALNRADRAAYRAEYDRLRRLAHPEATKAYAIERTHLRRARANRAGTYAVSNRDKRRALERARHGCFYCGARFSGNVTMEWDHVLPIVAGGGHRLGNLVPSCRQCNRSKARRTVMEWRMRKVISRRAKENI